MRVKIVALSLAILIYHVAFLHGSFIVGAIPYHVGSYWGIYIEEKMT